MSIDIGVRIVLEYIAKHPTLIIVALVLYMVVFLITVVTFGKKKGKNPLRTDRRRLPEPFVHDSKARELVLKERFKSSKVPENIDVIIIGSGIGGLTAGVLLTRAGKTVLVLEQHDQAGGCCHSFLEKGFEFDTGIHYIGGLQDSSVNRILLDQLTCGQLRWAKLDDAYDTVALGKASTAKLFHMRSGRDQFYENLIDHFPKERVAILSYKNLVKDAADSFYGIVALKVWSRLLVRVLLTTGVYHILFKCYRKRYTSKTLQEVLDQLTDNKELKLVLSYTCGDYGVLPKDAPFILHAILVNHYENGAYYPTNGPSEIAFHMVQSIRKGGGSVLMQAPVTKILCDSGGKAVGVQVGKKAVDVRAKYIISDAGVVNTFKRLLPENVAKASSIYPLIDKVGQSASFFTAFVDLEGSSSDLKLPAGNVWLYETDDINKTVAEYLNLKVDEIESAEIPFAYISFPSAKDPEWEKKFPGKSSALIITFANFEWFKELRDERVKNRGELYDSIKDTFCRKLWQKCVDLYPHLDGKKIYNGAGTPLTTQYYMSSTKGEMYGLDQRKERFSADVVMKLRPETDIKGLYLTGQDVMTCGFVSSLLMGVICTSKILNRDIFDDLLNLKGDSEGRFATQKCLSEEERLTHAIVLQILHFILTFV
uniref:Amine oxidase domain-containing protein n=1 Tax=Arion vulgaris TaxID=1028688 RepID=A0A0B7AWV0_9EUPU